MAALLIEHRWAEALEDAVARTGGAPLASEFVQARTLADLPPQLLSAGGPSRCLGTKPVATRPRSVRILRASAHGRRHCRVGLRPMFRADVRCRLDDRRGLGPDDARRSSASSATGCAATASSQGNQGHRPRTAARAATGDQTADVRCGPQLDTGDKVDARASRGSALPGIAPLAAVRSARSASQHETRGPFTSRAGAGGSPVLPFACVPAHGHLP
jgi:hypothetical protein